MTVSDQMEKLVLPEPKNIVTVAEFYKGRDVFITGGTGFMGKILIEKLLWACEDIGDLYLLIRGKKEDPQKRLRKLIDLPVFDRLKKRNASILNKIKPISGNIMDTNLGINDNDRKILEEKVSVIFHVASSVRFDDPLKKSIMINIRGTRDVLELAKAMNNLKAVNYVSTSYCNTIGKIIEEKVSQTNYNWKHMIKLAETTDEQILNILQAKILNGQPNTYTFTKSIAENIVEEYSKEIPCIIFRPSIVTYSIEEPIPGWVDNLNGPVGLSAAIACGVLHTLYGDPYCVTDYMPCDFAINGLIVSTWYRGISDTRNCEVINAASGKKKVVSTGQLDKIKNDVLAKYPPSKMLWFPAFTMTKNKFLFYFLLTVTQILPGFLIDTILKIKGEKFSLLHVYRKIYSANMALSYFLLNDWEILTQKCDSLMKFLTPEEQKVFSWDTNIVDERDALQIGSAGYKKFIFKDDLSESSLQADRRKFQRMYIIHRAFKGVCFLFFTWIMCKCILFLYLLYY